MSRRDEFVDAGMRQFGNNGYANTSIADIQLACGLTAGSGAMYKHFPSKEALLAEGIRRYVAELEESGSHLVEVLPDDPREALQAVASAVSTAMADDRSVIRVALRDLEAFPELLSHLWEGLLGALYRELTEWLCAQDDKGRISVVDPSATAAVLMASLTYYPILDALIGRVPGDVELSAFLAAWVDSAAATLHLQKQGTT